MPDRFQKYADLSRRWSIAGSTGSPYQFFDAIHVTFGNRDGYGDSARQPSIVVRLSSSQRRETHRTITVGSSDRDGFDNLIVLCGRHHKLVDDPDTRAQYPPEVLRSWKAEREAAYRECEPGADDGVSGPSQWPTAGSSLLHATTEADQVLAMELLALIDHAHDREAWDQFEQQNPALVKRARQSWNLIPPPIWSYLRSTGVELLKAALQGNQSETLSHITGQQVGFLRELHFVRQGLGGYILTDIGLYSAAAAVAD